ncbi:hypothetical protein IV203_025839 [Nitzschia inconspicua]|uniref:Glycine zipper domain-containing protein n=1 Tax=Nitzschia inconspicua TaxID=303405 RepID=A0A9K3PWE9_9STRA|nr:hypothetical protein IV203_017687 [Nitzschia inconspicua]KAG7362173.1 hypothetical protein IV203_025839 [Nitzschia inconspicua]
MTTPTTASSYPPMNYNYGFAQPPSSYEQQQQQQQQQPYYTGQIVPHYGPTGSYNAQYQNYQVPSSTGTPQYVSNTVSAASGNPPDLLETLYGSGNSYSLEQSPSGNTADDLFAAFEGAPVGNSNKAVVASRATPQVDDAFISSFSKEELAEQERLLKEIEQRKNNSTAIVPTEVNDMTVYQHQERLWNSAHQQQQQRKSNSYSNSMVPHSSSAYPSTMTVYESTNEHMIPVPRSHNPSGSDAVHPRRAEMKQARKVKTAGAATGGAIVGGIIFGPAWPLGVVVGGAAGAVAGKQISKAGERRAQRKWEKKSFQQYAVSESTVAKGGAAFA